MGTPLEIRALAFDTGGTVLDWHGGLVRALSEVGATHGAALDWHALANYVRLTAHRRRTGRSRKQRLIYP